MTSTKPDQYAVVGDPISHSKSPAIHKLFAEQTHQNLTYEAIRIDSESNHFAESVRELMALGFKGMNITVPFKLDAFEMADILTERAQTAQAVNTFVFQADGQILGDNTDGAGLVNDIETKRPFQNASVLILGAGGAVQGILQPLLAKNPSQVFIANRTAKRAQALAKRFDDSIQAGSWEDVPQHPFDIIINGTSASLEGKLPPVTEKVIGEESLVYDMMYGNEPTVFLKWAQNHQPKCQRMDGLGMLVGQAAEAFYLWRGVKPQTQSVIQTLREQMPSI